MLASASGGQAPCPTAAPTSDAALAPSPERHDATAVAADFARWPSRLRDLLPDRFPAPARRTAHRRDQGCTGSHFSPLMAAERRWDSPDAASLCLLGDVSPAWWGYWCQVLTVPYEHEGRRRRAHPDFLVRLADGSFTVFEVKPARLLTRDRERFAAIERACLASGVTYHVLTDTWLRTQPRLGNAALLHAAWTLPVTDDTVWHVHDLVRHERPATLGALVANRSTKGLHMGALMACSLRGAFRIDIENGPLGSHSRLHAATPRTDRRLLSGRGRRAASVSDLGSISGAA